MNYLRRSANYVWNTTDVLGKGATGSVYRGVDKKTGDSVAVKTFNHSSLMRQTDVQKREFEVMEKLTHENIVKMLAIEYEQENQKKVLVMELCDAGSLFTILDDPKNKCGLEEEEFLLVLKDVSAGMKYLRDNNIIHRDLKPGNIMKYISIDGRSIYKLTDFGAARELEEDQQFMSLYGTEEYLHPDMYERAVLRHPVSKSFRATVDLWSIGVTLYHVATGYLPFQPYGGRKNRETMHYITANKASGVISGVQHSDKGSIEWSRELPNTCLLNQGLRDLVTVLLAGILECNDEKMWTFDQFFYCVTDIITRKVFHVFYMNEGKEISLYMQPHKKLEDLKEEIKVQTKVPCANQFLLFDKSVFTSLIQPTSELSTYPTTSQMQPLILVHTENTNVKDPTQSSNLTASFPNFLSSINLDQDAAMAKTCCSVAHAVKRCIVKLVRCRELLLRTPHVLLSISHSNVSNLCSNWEILQHRLEDTYHRNDIMEKSFKVFSDLLPLLSQTYANSKEYQKLAHLVSEMQLAREKVKQKVVSLQSSIHMLKQKVLVTKRLQIEWDQYSAECSHLKGCVETAQSFVNTIHDCWQSLVRNKNARALSECEEEFHTLAKVRIQMTSKNLESLLKEKCLKSCYQASNKVDEWYSGMQAAMVQSKCLSEDLVTVNNIVKKYSSDLYEGELKAFELTNQIIDSMKSSELLSSDIKIQSKGSYLPEALMPKSSPNSQKTKCSHAKLLSQLQTLKQEHASLWEVAAENNSIIEKLTEMTQSIILRNGSCNLRQHTQ